MRKCILLTLLSITLGGLTPVTAQTAPWPEYTDAQRWERADYMTTIGVIAAMSYAKQHGSTLENFGRWWGDLFAPSWGTAGSYGPLQVMRGMRRNLMLSPGIKFEVLSESDSAVTARTNRPWTKVWGERPAVYGISLAEYEQLFSSFMRRIAEYHGLSFQERREGESWVFTYSRK